MQRSEGQIRPRIHWCPVGVFNRMPLHAAGVYNGLSSYRECCSDYVVSSYTPTLSALLYSRRRFEPVTRDTLSLVLVAEDRARNTILPRIPGAIQEVHEVADIAAMNGVKQVHQMIGSTTISNTCTLMEMSSILHLACHVDWNTAYTPEMGICLGDGELTVSRLMDLNLDNGFLAFLSACQITSAGGGQLDLASAMLFSGFKSVVGSMWYVLLPRHIYSN
jgi:CHAT domain-containing protein